MTEDDRDEGNPTSFEDTDYPVDRERSGGGRGSTGCGLIGCLLIIGILVASAVGVYLAGQRLEPLADRFLWAPHDVVREYLVAYEAGDLDRARGFLCAARVNAGVPDPSEPLGSPRSWTASVDDEFPYPRPNGQFGIYYQVTSGLGDRRGQALLVREESGWRICDFTV